MRFGEKISASLASGITRATAQLRLRLARPTCTEVRCRQKRLLVERLRPKPGVRVDDAWCCSWLCSERAAKRIAERLLAGGPFPRRQHRIPLGLLLLSRGHISAAELHRALELQHNEKRGRIGEWLLMLGCVSEEQVLAALAQQWACPILTLKQPTDPRLLKVFPERLVRKFGVVPVHFASASRTLCVAVSGPVDHTVLYAIERMLHCCTSACLISDRELAERLAQIPPASAEPAFLFQGIDNAAEIARISSSYGARLEARSLRLARAADSIWACLEGKGPATHLIFEGVPRPQTCDWQVSGPASPDCIKSAREMPMTG